MVEVVALRGYFISNDDDNSTKLLLFISPLPQIVLDERNPSGGLFDYAQSDIFLCCANSFSFF